MTDEINTQENGTHNQQQAQRLCGPDSTDLLNIFDEALNVRPHLSIEIGYTRVTDWMVHIWDHRCGSCESAQNNCHSGHEQDRCM